MKRNTRSRLLLTLLLGLGACTQAPELEATESGDLADGSVEIVYRGEPRVATRIGKLLLIEGDIAVSPRDMGQHPDWMEGDTALDALDTLEDGVDRGDGAAVAAAPLRTQGANFRWPGGVVPFQFGSYSNNPAPPGGTAGTLTGALSAAQQTLVQTAMDDWEERVEGLSFRPVRGTDSNFITFNASTVCSSRVGQNAGDNELGAGAAAGEQIIRLTNGCVNSASVHHEIAHALGVFHEQTRKDATQFVQINWANIRGCNNTATGPTVAQGCGVCTTAMTAANCGCTANQVATNTCNSFTNFTTDNLRANLGKYDYGSVMHYPATAFTKNGSPTLTVLKLDSSGNPFAIGQRVQISDRDEYGLNAMYPTLEAHTVLFEDTGTYDLCILQGRDEDRVGAQFTVNTSLPSGLVTDGRVSSAVSPGTYSVDCTVRSTFWSGNYNYPNSTVAFDTTQPAANVERYDMSSETLTVLDRGLIPVLF